MHVRRDYLDPYPRTDSPPHLWPPFEETEPQNTAAPHTTQEIVPSAFAAISTIIYFNYPKKQKLKKNKARTRRQVTPVPTHFTHYSGGNPAESFSCFLLGKCTQNCSPIRPEGLPTELMKTLANSGNRRGCGQSGPTP